MLMAAGNCYTSQIETFAKHVFLSLRGAKRRGNLYNIHGLMRLLHGACTERSERIRNDERGVLQRSQIKP